MTPFEEKIQKIVAQILLVDSEKITLESDLVQDLGADELDIVEIVMGLEDEFDLDITDEEVNKFFTFGDIIQYLKERGLGLKVEEL